VASITEGIQSSPHQAAMRAMGKFLL